MYKPNLLLSRSTSMVRIMTLIAIKQQVKEFGQTVFWVRQDKGLLIRKIRIYIYMHSINLELTYYLAMLGVYIHTG